ncbi:MAG: M20/M25/M40 family metallo-hydrolase [Butyricicoccus pullicaecorum]|nr:M20/M25/M40 family metallo-hydrolase [Butyricicoccus pullicaecorum]
MKAYEIEQQVRENFEWLCRVPHPPKGEQALAQKLIKRLSDAGWQPWQDTRGNVICDLPAASGRETEALVAVQAHLDMVCAVGDGGSACEPIHSVERDGWLCTEGQSSLGADCGAGVAVMLWAAEHLADRPPMRLIFTVEEEIGLLGAQALDPKSVAGVRYLINTDGFRWGRIVIGSASGVREQFTRPLTFADAPALPNGRAYRLTLEGFCGGHSGFDMGRPHENAVILMGEILRELRMESPFALAHFAGGSACNAIPYHCTAEILTIAPVQEVIEQLVQPIKARWQLREPEGRLTVEQIAVPQKVWNGDAASGLLTVLGGFADGVYAMHPVIPHVVADSSNLGHVYEADGALHLDAMIRCMDLEAEKALQTSHRAVAGMCGFAGTVVSRYPAWPSQEQGYLCQTAAAAFAHVTGQKPEITVQHVGLEPSFLLEKNPDMECICIGMEIEGCHSPKERWKLDTIVPFVSMLCEILKSL